MNKCYYTDRLEIENGELVRIVTAKAVNDSDKKLDVYKQYENGSYVCRNIYYSYAGYFVAFPGDITSLYGNRNKTCQFMQKLDEWAECSKMSFFSRLLNDDEKDIIIKKYSSFKYMLEKFPASIENTFSQIAIWKDHKEIEYVLASGFDKVAMNKMFWRLSEKNKKNIVAFIRNNQEYNFLSLLDIQTIIKHRIDVEEFARYREFCLVNCKRISFDLYKYLFKIGKCDINGVFLYNDYLNLLSQTQHDSKSDYWQYPKNLQEKHDELVVEVEKIQELKIKEQLEKKQKDYINVVKKLSRFSKKIDGYDIYVPQTVNDIKFQADKLHQCLVSADYISKVINKSCILVFIRKEGEPIATVQLFKDDSIGQFYTNELDRNNCLPDDNLKNVFDKWLEYKKHYKKLKDVA